MTNFSRITGPVAQIADAKAKKKNKSISFHSWRQMAILHRLNCTKWNTLTANTNTMCVRFAIHHIIINTNHHTHYDYYWHKCIRICTIRTAYMQIQTCANWLNCVEAVCRVTVGCFGCRCVGETICLLLFCSRYAMAVFGDDRRSSWDDRWVCVRVMCMKLNSHETCTFKPRSHVDLWRHGAHIFHRWIWIEYFV